MMKLLNIRYLSIMALVVVIYTISFNRCQEVHLLWMLPTSYLFFLYMQKGLEGVGLNLGTIIINIITFLRFVIIPLSWSLFSYYDGKVVDVVDYDKAIIVMCYELICVSIVYRCTICWISNHSNNSVSGEVNTSKNFVFIIVSFLWFLTIAMYQYFRVRLLNFDMSIVSNIISYEDATAELWNIPSLARIINSVGIHIVYVTFSYYTFRFIKNKPIQVPLMILWAILYASSMWMTGGTVSRWTIMIGLLVIMITFLYFYDEKKSFIFRIMGVLFVIAIVLGSMLKLATFGTFNNVTFDDFADYYLNAAMLDEYFNGIGPVANGLRICEVYTGSPYDIFTDFFGPVAFVGRLFNTVNYSIPNDYYHTLTGHTDLIIPNVSMSMLSMGKIFCPIYSCLLCMLALLSGNALKSKTDLYGKVLFIIPTFWFSLFFALNAYIIMNGCYTALFLIVFLRLIYKK